MLLVVPPSAVEQVRFHFDRWELHSDVVGEITDDGEITVLDDGQEVGRLPIPLLTDDVPMYVLDGRAVPEPPMPDLPPAPSDLGAALLDLLASPNICSRRPIFKTYDHTVRADTVVEPGFGAAVLRIRGTNRALAMTTDCNPRYCWASPRRGAAIAVAEAARNLACRGAEPVAVTDCLNFGNPERPEAYWELSEAIDGLGEACRALGVPIVSGNVSLYNETDGVAVKPSPIVGMVGLIEDRSAIVGSGFKQAGDVVLLLGPVGAELGCSEYLNLKGRPTGPAPSLDLDLERRSQQVVREAARLRLLQSVHDCSEGGLAVALAESCIAGEVGFRADTEAPFPSPSPAQRGRGSRDDTSGVIDALLAEADAAGQSARLDAVLFGEGQSRFVVSCRPSDEDALVSLAAEHVVPLRRLGTVGGDAIAWSPALSLTLTEVTRAWTREL
jgi:phosphoribosylformylglycinamidine synthase